MKNLVNSVQLIGHLGTQPEIKSFESGKEFVKFSMATNEIYKKADGEKVTKTEWHNIVVWDNKLVKLCKNYLKKGQEINLQGSISTRAFEGKNGETNYITEILARNILMLGKKNQKS